MNSTEHELYDYGDDDRIGAVAGLLNALDVINFGMALLIVVLIWTNPTSAWIWLPTVVILLTVATSFTVRWLAELP